MTIQERTEAIVADLHSARDWQARYKRIIELGRALPEMPDDARIDANKVKGCQSQVWLDASYEDGTVQLRGDSDAAIVKGLVAVTLHVYSGATPQEILATPPRFIDELGLSSNLSQTRANGLMAMIKQIQLYAVAFHAMTRPS